MYCELLSHGTLDKLPMIGYNRTNASNWGIGKGSPHAGEVAPHLRPLMAGQLSCLRTFNLFLRLLLQHRHVHVDHQGHLYIDGYQTSWTRINGELYRSTAFAREYAYRTGRTFTQGQAQ